MALVTRQGVHGTTSTAADSIYKNGFHISKEGRAGKGVYFWHVNIYVEMMAAGWVRSRPGHTGEKISLIYSELTCEEREILDMENQVLLDQLATSAVRRGITGRAKASDVHSLYESYVASLEKKLGTTFRMVQKKLAPPPSVSENYPKIGIGEPLAYIVRDVSIIKIGRRVDK